MLKSEKIEKIKLGKTTFYIGSKVQLKRHPKMGEARILLFYRDILGGVRLDIPLDGFRSWNVTDLEKVPRSKRRDGDL
jgi:hypothetical protein